MNIKSRTKVIRILFLFIVISITTGLLTAQNEEALKKKAAEIHEKVLTVDTHCDTPLNLLDREFDIGKRNDFEKTRTRIDFPRMKEGGMDAIFMAVFLGQGPRTPADYKKVREKTEKIFAAVNGVISKYSSQVSPALSPEDAYRIEKEGKRAIYIGIENGYPLGKDLSLIKKYFDMGARYITLCHTRNNDICDSSTDSKGPEHNGLSAFGKQVVVEMNRLGMMVDVSHISDKAFYDVLEVSRAPVIASHSSARAVCDNPRNLDDDMLKKIAEKGGVVQACILGEYVKEPAPNPERDKAFEEFWKKYSNFDDLSKEEKRVAWGKFRGLRKKYPREPVSVAEFVDHIDHIVKVVGIDYVGIGTDFDGGGGLSDCRDISEMGNITLELVRRGYTEEQIRKIWGGNIMRVFHEVENVAKKLQGKPGK